jgi:cytoskeletal protein RodZ
MIRIDYLRDLENNDFQNLPAPVYVTAYLRKICTICNADKQFADDLVSELHNVLTYEVPDSSGIKFGPAEIDNNEARKMKKIIFVFVAAVILFFALLAVGIVFLIIGGVSKTASTQQDAAFEQSALVSIQPKPALNRTKLPNSSGGR